MALVPGLLFLVGTIGCESTHETATEGHPEGVTEAYVAVRTEVSRRGVMSETVEGLGRCEALPDRIATLTPAVEGHVHKSFIKQGEQVKKGQPIIALDETVAPRTWRKKRQLATGSSRRWRGGFQGNRACSKPSSFGYPSKPRILLYAHHTLIFAELPEACRVSNRSLLSSRVHDIVVHVAFVDGRGSSI